MPKKNTPVSFDSWLGKVIDDETEHRGGRPAVADWIGVSVQSVNRRGRGDVPYLAREVEIIAEQVGVPTAEIVARALRGYGGMEKLLAEYAVSDRDGTVEPVDNVTYLGTVTPPLSAAADDKDETPSRD